MKPVCDACRLRTTDPRRLPTAPFLCATHFKEVVRRQLKDKEPDEPVVIRIGPTVKRKLDD